MEVSKGIAQKYNRTVVQSTNECVVNPASHHVVSFVN